MNTIQYICIKIYKDGGGQSEMDSPVVGKLKLSMAMANSCLYKSGYIFIMF